MSIKDDPDYLFTLTVRPYLKGKGPIITIHAFDTQAPAFGPWRITVEVKEGRKVIFKRGHLYCGAPQCGGMSIDGDEAKELVMSLVSMKPGDTDDEYFADYSEEQKTWASEHGDSISLEKDCLYCDPDGGGFVGRAEARKLHKAYWAKRPV